MKFKFGVAAVILVLFIIGTFYYKSCYIASIEEAFKRADIQYDKIYYMTVQKGHSIIFYGKDDILSVGLIKKSVLGYKWQCGYGSKQFNEKGRPITNAFSNLSTESKGNTGELVSLTYGVINNTDIAKLKIKYKDQNYQEAAIIQTPKGAIWFCFSDSPVGYDPEIIGVSESGETVFSLSSKDVEYKTAK